MFNIGKSHGDKSWSASINHSRTMTQIALGLTAVIIVQTIMLFRQETVVVVTPPNFTEAFTIVGDQVSEPYKSGFALFAANLAGNVSSKNADFVVKTLKTMFPVQYADEYENQLRAQIAALKARGVTEQFLSLDLIYNKAADTVWVYGDKRTISKKSGSQTTMKWTYEIRIAASNGYPKILHFVQYAGAPNTKGRMNDLRIERENEKKDVKNNNKESLS